MQKIIQNLQKVRYLTGREYIGVSRNSKARVLNQSVRAVCSPTVAKHVLRVVGQAALRKRQL